MACKHRDLELVTLLLDRGAEINPSEVRVLIHPQFIASPSVQIYHFIVLVPMAISLW
jgi:hypothetical protein